MSSKRARFEKLANDRVSRTLKLLDMISNLSNRVVYDYTASDVRQINAAIQDGLTQCKSRFDEALHPSNAKSAKKFAFQLKSGSQNAENNQPSDKPSYL